MKKIIAMLLALVLVMGLAACGATEETKTPENNNGTTQQDEKPESALAALEKIWGEFTDDEKANFPVMGGCFPEPVDGAPGNFSLEDAETVTAMLLVPAEEISKIDAAASMVNPMLSNNFTCAVFQVTGDAAAFAETMHTAVAGNQWMCGQPDKLIIAVIGGEYVLMVYGINDAMTLFEGKLSTAFPGADVKYNEAITG